MSARVVIKTDGRSLSIESQLDEGATLGIVHSAYLELLSQKIRADFKAETKERESRILLPGGIVR